MSFRPSKKQLFIGGSLLIVIFLIIAAVIFAQKLTKPYSTAAKISQTSSTQLTYSIDLSPINHSDHYVTYNYPKGLHLKSSSLIGPTSVDDNLYFAKDIYSWQLAIDIASTPTGQINQTSSYQFRKDNPQEYKEKTEKINGQIVDVMTDSYFDNGFSKVAYLTHGDLVATVSLIGNDSSGSQPLVTTFNMVLNSWQWF